MQKLKGVVAMQKISLLASCVAVCLSMISIISINKIKTNLYNNDIGEKVFKPIKDIPDVEVIKVDGSIEQINSTESKDVFGKLMYNKKDNKVKKQEQEVIKEAKKENVKQIKLNEKVFAKKEDKKDISNNVVKANKIVTPIERTKNTNQNKQNNLQQSKHAIMNEQNTFTKNKIHGSFVVQIGAFKDKNVAVKQCENVKNNLNGKDCNIATTNNQVYRSIIYPFNSYQDANEYLIVFSSKTRITGLIKKNA